MLVNNKRNFGSLRGDAAVSPRPHRERWQRELQRDTLALESARNAFDALEQRAGHELRAFSDVQAHASAAVVRQRLTTISTHLRQIDNLQHQHGTRLPALTDNLVIAALSRWRERQRAVRERAEREAQQEAPTMSEQQQNALNRLCSDIESDAALVKKHALMTGRRDPRGEARIFARFKARMGTVQQMLADDPQLQIQNPTVAEILTRAATTTPA